MDSKSTNYPSYILKDKGPSKSYIKEKSWRNLNLKGNLIYVRMIDGLEYLLRVRQCFGRNKQKRQVSCFHESSHFWWGGTRIDKTPEGAKC